MRMGRHVEALIQDVRFGIRVLLREREFTATVLVTLALSIGLTSAVFTLVDVLLLRPLPVSSPENLFNISARGRDVDLNPSYYSHEFYERLRTSGSLFRNLLASATTVSSVSDASGSVALQERRTSSGARYPSTARVPCALLGIQQRDAGPDSEEGFSLRQQLAGARRALRNRVAWQADRHRGAADRLDAHRDAVPRPERADAKPGVPLSTLQDEFDGAYEERTMFVLTLHPYLSGHRAPMRHLDEFVTYIKIEARRLVRDGGGHCAVCQDGEAVVPAFRSGEASSVGKPRGL